MNNQIRQAIPLSEALEDRTFEMQHEAYTLLETGKKGEALATIKAAWDLLPAPKFNTSCSHTILCDLVDILTVVGNYEEARTLLAAWRRDEEHSGFRIFDTTVFILSGENFLFLDLIDDAIACFKKANSYGAGKRDFSGRPSCYHDMADGRLTDHDEIRRLFKQAHLHHGASTGVDNTLPVTVLDQMEVYIEQGNSCFDDENYEGAIAVWKSALQLIPFPQHVYGETQWLETSVGDAFFLLDDFSEALLHFERAKDNIQEIAYENPFIMLRLGQCLFENKRDKEAAEYLLRAYMFEGQEIFADEDSKYFEFLRTQVRLD